MEVSVKVLLDPHFPLQSFARRVQVWPTLKGQGQPGLKEKDFSFNNCQSDAKQCEDIFGISGMIEHKGQIIRNLYCLYVGKKFLGAICKEP